MRYDLVTIFPRMVTEALAAGVIGRACDSGVISVQVHDLRDFADPPHRHVDDLPYGGGAGMVFRIEPWWRSIQALRRPGARAAVVLPSPTGERLTQGLVRELGEHEQLLLLCDRYEGSDHRLRSFVTHEVSLGDFVLSGGELAALAVVDATARLVPGVVGEPQSVHRDSFSEGLLEHGHYTRPAAFRGLEVPAVLLSGHHQKVAEWRSREGLKRTLERRPDLLDALPLGHPELSAIEVERRGSVAAEISS